MQGGQLPSASLQLIDMNVVWCGVDAFALQVFKRVFPPGRAVWGGAQRLKAFAGLYSQFIDIGHYVLSMQPYIAFAHALISHVVRLPWSMAGH